MKKFTASFTVKMCDDEVTVTDFYGPVLADIENKSFTSYVYKRPGTSVSSPAIVYKVDDAPEDIFYLGDTLSVHDYMNLLYKQVMAAIEYMNDNKLHAVLTVREHHLVSAGCSLYISPVCPGADTERFMLVGFDIKTVDKHTARRADLK